MELKFNFHISEDNFNHVSVVKKLAIPSGELLNKKMREIAIKDWFNFQRFMHPGEAIEWYEINKSIIPHIHIADVDFTELDNDPDVSMIYKKKTSGILTIRYLISRFNDDECKLIVFSNNLSEDDIANALSDEGLDSAIIAKAKDKINQNFIKTEQPLLKRRIQDKLKAIGKREFSLMDEGMRNNLRLEMDKGVYADWGNYIGESDNHFFYLRKLLVGWGDIRIMEKEIVNNIVEKLLAETESKIEFTGWWADIEGNAIPEYLNKYWNSGVLYNKRKALINLKTINVILDILNIKKAYEAGDDLNIPLTKNNKLYKVTELVRGSSAQKIFDHKLIARRVIICCSNMFYEDDVQLFDLPALCSLVCYNQTKKMVYNKEEHKEKDRKSSWIGTAFRNYFGLRKEDRKVPIEVGKIMGEEYNFYKKYVESGTIYELRKFLDEYELPLLLLNSKTLQRQRDTEFNDLEEFNEFVFKVQIKSPKLLNNLIDDIKEKSSDNVYDFLKKANPVYT